MGLKLDNLDTEGVRELMIEEIDLDISSGVLYQSKRLKEGFEKTYIELFKDAVINRDSDFFSKCIFDKGCLAPIEPSGRSRTGWKKVPKDAHITLCEGEFNRFYIRGLCRKAIADGDELEIYRAKEVRNPRSASTAMIGQTIDANKLLKDLRSNIGVETVLGVPPGPNSGLSVRIRN